MKLMQGRTEDHRKDCKKTENKHKNINFALNLWGKWDQMKSALV